MNDLGIYRSPQIIHLKIAEFNFKITTPLKIVIDEIQKLYCDFIDPTKSGDASFLVDFDIKIDRPANLRRWIKPQVCFSLNNKMPFKPLPLNHAFAMLEWGMNWCIANHAHHYLMFHSAVIEKNGKAIILPAPQGSGKSTLTAAMVYNGWRLLSDEIAMVSLKDSLIYPISRPISLKNESIEVIKEFIPNAKMSRPAYDTHKGTVSLIKPPSDSVKRNNEPCAPAYIVFPKFEKNSKSTLTIKSKGSAFIELADNSFNYHVLGIEGFNATADIIENVECYSFVYSKFSEAISTFEELV